MKSITLNTAAADNSGTRRAAGELLTLGGGRNQIEPARARELVARGSAAEVAQPRKPHAGEK